MTPCERVAASIGVFNWNPDGRIAIVVFGFDSHYPWLRFLRKGFRHCFVLLDGDLGGHWVMYNPLVHQTQVDVLAPMPAAALEDHFLRQGCTVVRTRIRGRRRQSLPWRPYTCVEAVKRVIGLKGRFVLTPWQLYKALVRADAAEPRRPA